MRMPYSRWDLARKGGAAEDWCDISLDDDKMDQDSLMPRQQRRNIELYLEVMHVEHQISDGAGGDNRKEL